MAWHTQTFIHSHTRALTRTHEYIKSWKSIINRITSHRRAIFPLGGNLVVAAREMAITRGPILVVLCNKVYIYLLIPLVVPQRWHCHVYVRGPLVRSHPSTSSRVDTGPMLAGRLSYGPRCHPEHPGSLIWASTTAVQSSVSSVLCPPVSVWRKDVGHGIDEKPHIYGR